MGHVNSQEPSNLGDPYRPPSDGRWRPTDVAVLVVASCYGGAALVLAWAIFVRLVR
jgi:hypothetical protein